MRPIALHGHTRAVTMVKYNREGDLLFSTAKDMVPTVWSAETGERLGTYEGHTGAVWGCDVNASSTLLATAGADQSTRIWNVETGEMMAVIKHPTACRSVSWAHGDRMLCCITDKSMGNIPAINLYNIPEFSEIKDNKCEYNPFLKFTVPEKINMAVWGPTNETIYFCSEDGSVAVLDVQKEKEKCFNMPHNGYECRRLRWDSDYTTLITSGWDKSSKLLDMRDVSTIKTYPNDFPVNDACILPTDVMNHICMGGGLDAQSVTNVSAHQNKFDIKFCHKVFGNELGAIAGHFGPVNALATCPVGRSFASGGEDGFVRLHHFDADFYDAPGRPDEFA
ncbi:Eukaryotic translation initiation factor 3 subunit I [Diplonema papillatum]|nr:Eukaryotic translation initiation factor 3 subunit I [Diplonema papillatum]